MVATLPLSISQKNFLGTRYSAKSLRQELSDLLADSRYVIVDFGNIGATQSFVDELIGVLILKNGPEILKRMKFRNCSEDVKAIIRLVASKRIADFERLSVH